MIHTPSFRISRHHVGTIHGQQVYQFRLDNGNMTVDLLNYGCIIMSIRVPDRDGKMSNVVAGFEKWEQYLDQHPYFGCVIGRYANRIAAGKFSLDGKSYQLPVNNPPNHLHGGFLGFDKKLWQVESIIEEADRAGVVLQYLSVDGEEGYPGNLNVRVTYLLQASNCLEIHYAAFTDQTTIVNLTNHAYFNLTAFEESSICNHHLIIRSNQVLEKNDQQVPSGKQIAITGGPFDFSTERKIGNSINEMPPEGGYDHTFVLEKLKHEMEAAAILTSPTSGRLLKLFTDQPALHIYTANFWDGQLKGMHPENYLRHGAVAIEAQAFPDAPNHPAFPSTVLHPGEVYHAKTVLQFLLTD